MANATNIWSRSFLASLALCACGVAFCVIGLGAFTRLIDAGLGCPDWPGCYGYMMPSSEYARHAPFVAYKAWAEMIHRYFAGTLSLLTLSVLICIGYKNNRNRFNIFLGVSLFFLIIYQILLGQWTVTLKLLPIIVSQHLLGGYSIIVILWLVYLNNKPLLSMPHSVLKTSKTLIIGASIALILLYLQIFLGAWTSTNYASLSCPDFPFCVNNKIMTYYFREAYNLFSPVGVDYEGGVLPTAIRQTIQMTHRLGAGILTCYLFVFSMYAMVRIKDIAILKSFYLVLGLLCLQIFLGVSNVMFKLPLITAVSHNLIAVLLLLSLVTLLFKLVNPRAQN